MKEAQQQEQSFDEGLAVGIAALLVSPDFLFRIERDRPLGPTRHVASDHPARARDAPVVLPLGEHAGREPAPGRRRRARCAIPWCWRRRCAACCGIRRSHALAEHFGGQWLQFRALESVTRDRERFPDFEDYLRLSMRSETELFVEHVIREDRSILDFIDGRYTFVNERLAKHYGIPDVSGPEFRRVDLTGTPRGGVVTQGSVLTVSSYATRTSPVLRGKWILENLLNAPPPEPPADVPNLDETNIGTSASVRMQLEEHRKNPTCASCHRRMDPLGFGLENFDAVGAWRTMDGKLPIDSAGTLPDGRTFNGPEELRHDPVGRPRRLLARADVEAVDLCARPRPRALRHEDRQGDRRSPAGAAVPVLGPGPGDREEPAVPVAAAVTRVDTRMTTTADGGPPRRG